MSKVEKAIDVTLSGWQQWLLREPDSKAAQASVEAAQAVMKIFKAIKEDQPEAEPVKSSSQSEVDRALALAEFIQCVTPLGRGVLASNNLSWETVMQVIVLAERGLQAGPQPATD